MDGPGDLVYSRVECCKSRIVGRKVEITCDDHIPVTSGGRPEVVVDIDQGAGFGPAFGLTATIDGMLQDKGEVGIPAGKPGPVGSRTNWLLPSG